MYKVEYIITNNNLPLLSQLEPLMRARLLLSLEQIGLILERGAVLAIQNQIAPDGTTWEALQDWYVEWKRRKGFSDNIYIMSSSYQQAITHKTEGESEEMAVIVGVMKDSGSEVNGEDIWKVAEVLEYGWEQFNVRIPPRPLWTPLLAVNKRSIQTRIGTAIYWSAREIEKQAKGMPGGKP